MSLLPGYFYARTVYRFGAPKAEEALDDTE